MKKLNPKTKGTMKGILILFGAATALIVPFIALALWTDRNLEFAISAYKGVPVELPLWISLVANLLNVITLLFNVVCEIARFVI